MYHASLPADENALAISLAFKDRLGADMPPPDDVAVISSDPTVAVATLAGATLNLALSLRLGKR